MPSDYDEMSPRAYSNYDGGTAAGARAPRSPPSRDGAGSFTVEPKEWWHFNYKDWNEYPILDIPFTEIPLPPARVTACDNRPCHATLQAPNRM